MTSYKIFIKVINTDEAEYLPLKFYLATKHNEDVLQFLY